MSMVSVYRHDYQPTTGGGCTVCPLPADNEIHRVPVSRLGRAGWTGGRHEYKVDTARNPGCHPS